MKLDNNTSQHTTTITKAADFGINDDDLSHIMGILRSQIYSDKLMAVIREYSTNATDANIEAGIPNQPIQVHLPTLAEPYISFRDFGSGLSDDQVTTLYTKYGASTKRDSNSYTGCLGIGCKAGFAYGDNFKIITYRKDKVQTWLARIDESKRGTISLLCTETNTSNKTGTEISVSIRREDIENCVEKAQKLFKYWDIAPICNIVLPKVELIEDNEEWALVKLKPQHYYHKASAKLIMGNIVYPIDKSQISENSGLLQHECVLIKAPVGAVDVAANREALEYTNRTKDSLIAMVHNLLSDCILNITKSIKDAPTRVTASINATKYDEVFDHNILTKIKSAAKWNNLPLITNLRFHNNKTTCHSMNQVWSSGTDKVYRNKRDKEVRSMRLKNNSHICVYDDTKYAEANATRRVRTLQSQNSNVNDAEYYVLPKSCIDVVEPKLTTADYVDLDTITPLKANRTTITSTVNGNTKKVRVNVCVLTANNLKSKRVSAETEPTLDKTHNCYVYVPLDRFDWEGKPTALDNLKAIMESLHTMLGYYPVIHGVKKHHVSKLNNDWMTLDTFFSKTFKVFKANNKSEVRDAIKITSCTENTMPWSNRLTSIIAKSHHHKVSEFARIHELLRWNQHRTNKYTQVCEIAYLINVLTRSNWYDEQAKYIKENHIILSLMTTTYMDIDTKTETKLLTEINILVNS